MIGRQAAIVRPKIHWLIHFGRQYNSLATAALSHPATNNTNGLKF
jgi:hypothetical protein